ncbi:MAG: J domain-containing protein [Clostridia bacterium]|nr:J domain-containing protein [Clostridia bacterium]
MKDPFETLGIPSTSSEDEIKSAYRTLAKKYHPDLHPGDKQAEEKMKEVNEAYAEAMRVKKEGGYRPEMYGDRQSSTSGANPYGSWNPFGTWQWEEQRSYNPFGTAYQTASESDPRLQAAMDNIQTGRYQAALDILRDIPGESARWHYLNALAHQGMKNQVAAYQHARSAVQMEPDNLTYRALLNQLQGASATYRQRSGNPFGRTACYSSPCMSLLAINMLMRCLCGRGGYFLCC